MKIAYFDCFAGASGDMIVAAMLDAGLDAEFLRAQLVTLGIENLDIKVTETRRAGIRAISFEPVTPKQEHHRNIEQIRRIIRQSKINDNARKSATTIFEKIAQAEAAVHNRNPDDIHFHELGAVDSIVDIVSACVGIEALGIEKIYCSPLSVGGGTVRCAHSSMPVPAPATAELLKGVPIAGGPAQAELLTPTGAAILTTVVDEFGPLPSMKIDSIGYGAGSMQFEDFPNALRLVLGQAATESSADADTVCLLETNIDDASGELLGCATEALFERGALDVFTTPIQMKQNRPAVQVSVICKAEDTRRLEQVLFREGLTFGIRKQVLQRSRLSRNFVPMHTKFGEIRIKTGSLRGRIVNAKPEFSDCVSAAKKHNESVKTVQNAAMAAWAKAARPKK